MLRGVLAVSKFGLVAILAPTIASQTTLWVDKDKPGDDGNFGTQANPFATISKALDVVHSNSGAYIIKVVDADYTQAHETTFAGGGYPLDIAHADGLTIIGVDASGDPPTPAEYPRIGGDVGQSAAALLSLILTGADNDAESIDIRNLHFLGEDETSSDSPIAVEVGVEDANSIADFIIQNNTFERPYFNGSGTPRATIHIEVRNGEILTRGSGYIAGNTVYCSERGGIEVIAAAEDDEIARTNFAVERNVFKVTLPDEAEFGLKWLGENMGGPAEGLDEGYFGLTSISGNTVLGRGKIGTGVMVKCEEHSQFGQGKHMDENVISGCTDSAIDLSVDGWGDGSIPEIATTFVRNRLINNLGSGLVLRWDENALDDGEGYLVLISEGNLIAENAGYGIEVHGYGDSSTGSLVFHNETIAENALGAEGYFDLLIADDWGLNGSPVHVNCIVYGNGAGDDAQVEIEPDDGDVLDDLLVAVSYSNWTGIALSNGNIDDDPDFVNAAIGNFHLLATSPCIDAGENNAANEVIDIDDEDRIQDGICPIAPEPIVDMGYDEFPEPDCE